VKSILILISIIGLLILALTVAYFFLKKSTKVETAGEKSQYITDAYFEVFKKAYEREGYNYKIKYVSVDLNKIKVIDKEILIPLLEEFCKDEGLQLLQYTNEELFDKGYGDETNLYLTETILIYLSDAVIKKNKVYICGGKFRDSLASFRADYMLYKEDGMWVVDVSNIRIS